MIILNQYFPLIHLIGGRIDFEPVATTISDLKLSTKSTFASTPFKINRVTFLLFFLNT